MNCEYSEVITLTDIILKQTEEIAELKKKLQRDDEILTDQAKLKKLFNPNYLWNADRSKYSKYCPNYDSDFDK